nr:Hsp70 family protein [Micromonospora sp. DSM 115978]
MFSPAELVTAVIDALKLEAEKLVGHAVRRAVITIPSSYGPGGYRRQLMIDAAEAAGFIDVDLLAEPVAAAWAPMVGNRPAPGDLLAIYDFGGGTFDATLIGVGEAGRHDLVDHA